MHCIAFLLEFTIPSNAFISNIFSTTTKRNVEFLFNWVGGEFTRKFIQNILCQRTILGYSPVPRWRLIDNCKMLLSRYKVSNRKLNWFQTRVNLTKLKRSFFKTFFVRDVPSLISILRVTYYIFAFMCPLLLFFSLCGIESTGRRWGKNKEYLTLV